MRLEPPWNPDKELRRLEEKLRKAEKEAAFWLDSWQGLLDRVSDTYHRAKAKPKGKRFVTLLETATLLSAQEEDEGDET